MQISPGEKEREREKEQSGRSVPSAMGACLFGGGSEPGNMQPSGRSKIVNQKNGRKRLKCFADIKFLLTPKSSRLLYGVFS